MGLYLNYRLNNVFVHILQSIKNYFKEKCQRYLEIHELAVVDDELASKLAASKHPTSKCGWTVMRR